MTRKPASPRPAPWPPEGPDRAALDGLEQAEAPSLEAWLAAGGERRRWPRPGQPLRQRPPPASADVDTVPGGLHSTTSDS